MSFKLFGALHSNRWSSSIRKCLIENANLSSLDEMVNVLNETIGSSSSSYLIGAETEGLCTFTKGMGEYFSTEQLASIFKKIMIFALKIDELFPTYSVQSLGRCGTSVELKRHEISCLLAHMFLCTFCPRPTYKWWATFEIWIKRKTPCSIAYLATLLKYFEGALIDDEEIVSFERTEVNANNLKGLDSMLESVFISLHGAINYRVQNNDSTLECAEVNFANRELSFGNTGTQEEMTFGASPEMSVLVLFCTALTDSEAVIIRGVRKVAEFSGYGLDIHIDHFIPPTSYDWARREIIAIDAMDFGEALNPLREQLKDINLSREIQKTQAGFGNITNTLIMTGFWGCGAFSGNPELKTLIQWISASVRGKRLIFCCFGNLAFFERFKRFSDFIQSQKVSIDKMRRFLFVLSPSDEASIFDQIEKLVQQES
jgi:poly(ADP-ribose) glycohydrolase